MYFLNTEMHIVTFLISVFEIVMLVFQSIYFLQRPSDKTRLHFLLLLLCLIGYNVCGGLFPDEQYIIPTNVQLIVTYFFGFAMAMYVVFYFYKVFDLPELRFFATYGVLLFLLLPFIFLFVVPLLLTGDYRLSAKLSVTIPFLYGLAFVWQTSRALTKKLKSYKKQGRIDNLYGHALTAFISLLCWASLPIIVFLGDFQVLEHSFTNAGFLMMTIIYVKSAIRQSREEYEELIESKHNLMQLNQNLKKKVRLRTKKLERIMEERRTTFINLAHETKTPLTLINNYLDEHIHKAGESDEMKIVRSNIKRLTNDVVNFFDVESYEKGFSMYNHNKVSDFASLLKDKLPLFTAIAAKKGILFTTNIDDGVFVIAHPGAIDRIINNLLENAIKYSERDNSIEIRLYCENDQCVFYVKDSGYGIPEEFREKVFEPYFKLLVGGRNSDGMGMGLSIVKKIVSDIGGSIELFSEIGKGTLVKIFLPSIDKDSIKNSRGDGEVDHRDDETFDDENRIEVDKPFILIVEDNLDMLNFLRNKLNGKYNVVISRNGKEALEKLNSLSALDLIISDVMMDDMDGYELCQTINSTERFAHIPFIFLSAKGSAEDRLKGLSLGAISYIEKPFEIEELLMKVDSILSNLKRQRAAVINQAYRSILSDKDSLPGTIVSQKRCAFTVNCKKYRLTSREVEIIKLLIKGNPYKQMGDVLGISDKTVAKHVSNIFSKVIIPGSVT